MDANGKRRALSIAISFYKEREYVRLPGVERDLPRWRDLLDSGLAEHGTHSNEPLENGNATEEGIRQELAHLADEASRSDQVIIYFAGHGVRLPGPDGKGWRYFLLPYDAGAAHDDREPGEHWISAELLGRLIARVKAREIVLILDCCHADGVDPNFPSSVQAHFGELGDSLKADEQSMMVIASARGMDKAGDLDDGGFLIAPLCEVLGGTTDLRGDAEGRISLLQAFSAMKARAKERLDICNQGQPYLPHWQDIVQLSRGQDIVITKVPVRAHWKDPPFPGLRPFKEDEAAIFFGRQQQLEDLVARLRQRTLVAVVGSSGAGKSSLVIAGLLPLLRKGALPNSMEWLYVEPFTPARSGTSLSANPLEALAERLVYDLPRCHPADVAKSLAERRECFGEIVTEALAFKKKKGMLLVIDQLEELFTEVHNEMQRARFAELLEVIAADIRVYCVVTLRADFYPRCLEHEAFTRVLQDTTFPLGPPDRSSLREMVSAPAAKSGIAFEEGLVKDMVSDAGGDASVPQPGALSLLAYALGILGSNAMHNSTKCITRADYERIGGVRGALARRAEEAFNRLNENARNAFASVFRELIHVDETGAATRRCASLLQCNVSESARSLVDAFSEPRVRLLVIDKDSDGQPFVTVAHEALFEVWPRLRQWIDEHRQDLWQFRIAVSAASAWKHDGRSNSHLWPDARVENGRHALERLGLPQSDLAVPLRDFLRTRLERLVDLLKDRQPTQMPRWGIGDELENLGSDFIAQWATEDNLKQVYGYLSLCGNWLDWEVICHGGVRGFSLFLYNWTMLKSIAERDLDPYEVTSYKFMDEYRNMRSFALLQEHRFLKTIASRLGLRATLRDLIEGNPRNVTMVSDLSDGRAEHWESDWDIVVDCQKSKLPPEDILTNPNGKIDAEQFFRVHKF